MYLMSGSENYFNKVISYITQYLIQKVIQRLVLRKSYYLYSCKMVPVGPDKDFFFSFHELFEND